MNYQIISPEKICAKISLPASKSISNRVLVINALSGDKTHLPCISECDDTRVVADALSLVNTNDEATIDIHASGTAMRFLTAYLATQKGNYILTGTERMKQRPIAPLVDALREMGAEIDYLEKEGFPPLRITGAPMQGGRVEITGSISSQFITALLLIAPVLPEGLDLIIKDNITSRPYIDLTLDVMQSFGAEAGWESANRIVVAPKPYCPPASYHVESDWSAASYWYEMLALSDNSDSEIYLRGLIDGSRQGDSVVRYLFSMLGVKTTFETDDDGMPMIHLRRHFRTLPRLDYDFKNQPDIAQTFVVTCCMAGLPFRFTGLSTLKIKETDRLAALHKEMQKLGYEVVESGGDTLEWKGDKMTDKETNENVVIETYNDHRMAMPFAAASVARKGIIIENPTVVEKSYPSFWDDMKAAGFLCNTL